MENFQIYREDRWPHMFCPGCGIGTVMSCFQRAFLNKGLDLDRTAFVSGIGCSSRLAGYVYADSLHTTHGRALAFATGLKLAQKDLEVVVFTGDGDLGSIGGNHFIQACRRNMDLFVVCVNNNNYGMTGGQVSSTTWHDYLTTTTPKGNPEYPFDLSRVAATSGANYVARYTTAHPKQLVRVIEEGLGKKGLRFIEAWAACPTYYGRYNKMASPVEHTRWLKENSIHIEQMKVDGKTAEDDIDLQVTGKVTIGVLRDADRMSYLEAIQR
ncbi:MAG: 2-oxoacid:ferredoxin oxidoreductase subunit beta [Methanobacteriota archaeon]|nr:MAG: 2-oxoacid:ferredoxin oxidoreductase subunit beta [Euryarchaeota archaeon]